MRIEGITSKTALKLRKHLKLSLEYLKERRKRAKIAREIKE